MKLLIVGSGAREHAIAWKVAQSSQVKEIHAAPGNAGIAQHATCHDVAEHDIDAIAELAQKVEANLVIVGPEAPLVAGLSNRLKKIGIPCFGPSAAGARIEGSKVFAKELMDRVQVPTARWEAFSDVQAAIAAINRWRGPVVIKADGITHGRGAFVCMKQHQAQKALELLLVDSVFGIAGRRVVVEEYLQGTEASIMAISDGENIVPLPVVRSVKRRNDENSGPNTDGMGAYMPVDELYEEQIDEAVEAGLRPVIDDMKKRGLPYIGVLYADVMFTKAGPKILEFNCRFGEPELQAIVSTFDGDFFELLYKAATSDLAGYEYPASDQAVAVVSMVANSYPNIESEEIPVSIGGLADVDGDDVEVFFGNVIQAGTKKTPTLAACGGRVLAVVAVADSIDAASAAAQAAVEKISFDGAHWRTDVAADAIAYV